MKMITIKLLMNLIPLKKKMKEKVYCKILIMMNSKIKNRIINMNQMVKYSTLLKNKKLLKMIKQI